jgi:NADH-quinone oxidoreductase subunit G
MPKVVIDGQEIHCPAGTTVLQAALSVGREIPHYCYHPGLSIAGNCRMCLVEVEKAPKLLISCYERVADGMVVRTETERVRKARAAMMEFFLIHHPLDCPICDQAGECRLQDYAVAHGTGRSRYTEPKRALAKAVDIGAHVLLDQERCIQCSRCIRFCQEVTKTGELAFFDRGDRTVIGIYPGRRLDNPYSGNVVDLCPVGALTLKEFRFQTRVWYLRNTPSVCAACARGCNVVIATGTQNLLMTTRGQQDDRIRRIVPRANPQVNGWWICDEGRLCFLEMEKGERLRTAQMPRGTEADWEEAVAAAASALREAARAGRAGAILSPRLVTEDLFAWRELFGRLGSVRIGVRRIFRGRDDDLLIRADKGANSAGAVRLFGEEATEEAVVESARRGQLDALFVAGDPLDPHDTAEVPPDVRGKVPTVLYVGPFVAGAAADATILLPAAAWGEQDGTYVNFEGRLQLARRARVPLGEARPGWAVAREIGEAAGVSMPGWTSWGEVLVDIARAVPAFSGADPEAIGLLGLPLGVGAPAGA